MGPAVQGVDPPCIHSDLHAAQAGHGIDKVQAIIAPGEGADLRYRIGHPGGSFRMDHGEEPVISFPQFFPYHGRVHRRSPGELHDLDIRTQATGDLPHPHAEHPIDQYKHPVARLHEVDKASLHAGGAGSRHGDGKVVCCVHDLLQQDFQLIHDRQEIRVQVSQRRAGQGTVNSGGDTGWPRSHQEYFFNVIEKISFHNPTSLTI
ncbi:MAG TPA: hypothetical protein PLU95_08390 [Syntrophales bacterium]|nr:hypothetical protein [Syntrophales bacterium]